MGHRNKDLTEPETAQEKSLAPRVGARGWLSISLRSKSFREVFCTKTPISVFLHELEMRRERRNGGGGEERRGEERRGRNSPLPSPSSVLFALAPFRARPKIRKSAF